MDAAMDEVPGGGDAAPTAEEQREEREEFFLSYLTEGISVIPLAPGTKKPYTRLLPAGSWKTYTARHATPQEVRQWCLVSPLPDIGIVLGAISRELTCLDAEKIEYCAWLEDYCLEKLLSKTWVTRTGSGLLHVYLRSRQPVITHDLKVPPTWSFDHDSSPKLNRDLLAEIRANARTGGSSYVCAPPSRHPSGGLYTDLYGEPKTIQTVDDAGWLFERITEAFKKSYIAPATSVPQTVAERPRVIESVLPEDIEDYTSVPASVKERVKAQERERLLQKLKSGNFEKSILTIIAKGAEWNLQPDDEIPNHSDVDFKVLMALRLGGWTWDECEDLFASFPVGKYTYQATDRSNHGRRYLWGTLANVDSRISETITASRDARGADFKVVGARLFPYDDDPYYELDIEMIDGRSGTARVLADELSSETLFHKAIFRSAHLVLHFKPDQMKKPGWRDFMDGVSRMAERQQLSLTRSHHIEQILIGILKQNLRPQKPPDGRFHLGWRDKRNFYVDPSDLLSMAHAAGHRDLRASLIGEVFLRWGATRSRPEIGGERKQLYKMPSSLLGKEVLMLGIPEDQDEF